MSRRLVILGGTTRRELTLVGTMVVGRDPMCDVSESDPLLSRRHAEFVAGATDVTVRDLGSLNGILVNGVKRPEAVLRGGDVVQVGHLQVRFLDESGPSPDWSEADLDAMSRQTAAARVAGALGHARDVADESPAHRTLPTIHRPLSDDLDRTSGTLRLPGSPVSPAADDMWETSPLDVKAFVGPDRRIRFDMPKRGWRVVSGGMAAIVSLAHDSGEASMVVERATPSGMFLTGEAGDRFAEREADAVRAQQPEAAEVEAALVTLGTRSLVILTYSRKGVAGPERVRQYSIPAGSELYRLTCSADTSQFFRFEPVFALVASTFATGTTS